jgi:N-acetylneuraminic acid mutarotase
VLAAALPLAAIGIARFASGWLTDSAAAASEWKWTTGPKSLVKRTEVAAAQAGRSIYVIGGFEEPGRTTAVVERYEIDARRWSKVQPLPVPLNHAAAVGYRGSVYVLGGYAGASGLSEPVATLYRYDPARDRWAKLPSAPTARAALALGAMGGRLYAAGGAGAGGAMSMLEIYDIAGRRWSTGPPMSVPREHLGGATLRGAFYAVAGRNPSGNFAIVERYAPGNGWTRLPDLAKPRGGNGAAAWAAGRRVFAVGGEEGAGTIAELEAYDGKRWRRLPDMPTPRHGLGVVFDQKTRRLYVLEGGPQPGFAFSDRLEVLRRR